MYARYGAGGLVRGLVMGVVIVAVALSMLAIASPVPTPPHARTTIPSAGVLPEEADRAVPASKPAERAERAHPLR